MSTRRMSDHFRYRIVKTDTGYEARRANPSSSRMSVNDVHIMNYRTAGFRSSAGDTFTLRNR